MAAFSGRMTRPVLLACIVVLHLSFSFPCVSGECPADRSCQPLPADLLNKLADYTDRTLTVSSTCGDPDPTKYMQAKDTLAETEYDCTTNAGSRHPQDFMIDFRTPEIIIQDGEEIEKENPNLLTYWQSKNMIAVDGGDITSQYVELQLGALFLIRSIRIIFPSPHVDAGIVSDMRPTATLFERKTVVGSDTYVPWRYFAEDCAVSFNGVPILEDGDTPPINQAVCVQKFYPGDVDTQTNYDWSGQAVS